MKLLGIARLLLDVDGGDHHGDDRQPRERRHRLEDLNDGIERGVEGARQPAQDAERYGDDAREQEPGEDRLERGQDLVEEGRAADIGAPLDLRIGVLGERLGVALLLALVIGGLLVALGEVVGPQHARPGPSPATGPGMAPSEVTTRGASTAHPHRKTAMASSGTSRPCQISFTCCTGRSPTNRRTSGTIQPSPSGPIVRSSRSSVGAMRSLSGGTGSRQRCRRWLPLSRCPRSSVPLSGPARVGVSCRRPCCPRPSACP